MIRKALFAALFAPALAFSQEPFPKACPGCCSSHGGITNMCGTGGRVLCADGTTSPTCACSSCGVSTPTPTPSPTPSPTPTPVPTPTYGPSTNYTDLWWNAAESGWGLNLVQHANNIIFGTLYKYDQSGQAAWIFMPSGSWSANDRYTGGLYRAQGPTSFELFDAGRVTANQVGNATLQFTSSNHAVFSYTIDGVSGTKDITRVPF